MIWRRRQRHDEDFDAEVRAHLEHETDRLIADGLSPADARAAAMRRFGNVTRVRERYYERRRLMWVEQFFQDLRYAWRGLWKNRAFVATTSLTLAVGMGLVTVVFAIFNAYVLRPFAVHDPYSLYTISWRSKEAGGASFRWKDYQEIQTRTDLFDGVIAVTSRTLSMDRRLLSTGFVSGNYFEVLGARVVLGRNLDTADAQRQGSDPIAILSYQAWTRLFDRDPAVVGRELQIDGQKVVIVGIMNAEFTGLDDAPADMWMPLTSYETFAGIGQLFGPTEPRALRLTARLRHDVEPAQAQGSLALESFATREAGRIDAVRARLDQRATPFRMTRNGFALLSPIIAAFALVLVAACANASNVMLARANARHREIGIRLSIGASRARLIRQLTTEGLLIAGLGAVGALAIAAALLRVGTYLFVVMLPPSVAARVRFVPLDFDYRVFLFTLALVGAATLVFALLPALQATKMTLTDALRGQPGAGVRSATLRNLLVTSQVSVSLVLLVVAVTLVRNAAAIRGTELGLDISGIMSVRQYRNDGTLVRRAYETLSADPRIGEVAVTSRNPLFGDAPGSLLRTPTSTVIATYSFVSANYFEMLRIPILRGRGFSPDEVASEAPVVVVSAAGAKALWPGEDPIGKSLRVYIPPPQRGVAISDMVVSLRRPEDLDKASTVLTVIGVSGDAINGFVYQGTDPCHLYIPTTPSGPYASALMVRGRTATTSADVPRSILAPVAADSRTFDVLAVEEMVALQMFPIRAASWIGSLLSAIALVLSVTGLYGVLTYTFGQRTQEIGIRMALGATARAVITLVAVQSARLASVGVALGGLAAFGVMKLLSRFIRLENVSVVDPGAFAISLALIAVALVLATSGPARRATRVDPSTMFRADA
jgi:predicted permease